MVRATQDQDREARSEYFDMLAEIGVTKHFGSLKATNMLAKLSNINATSYVLDVGCGVGLTPAYLARRYRCRIVGIDITQKMLVRAREEIRRRGVRRRVTLATGDAQALPFGDGLFDVTMAESVGVFLADRELGFREYARVTKPGGYVAVTEPTWLAPPTARADAYMSTLGAVGLDREEWVTLMEQAGLRKIVADVHRIDLRSEASGRVERLGIFGLLRLMDRTLRTLLLSRRARRVIGRSGVAVPQRVLALLGYGIYVGRKL